jgi:hypothetical protein
MISASAFELGRITDSGPSNRGKKSHFRVDSKSSHAFAA